MKRDTFLRNDDQYMGYLKYPIGIAIAQEQSSPDGSEDNALLYVCDGENTRIVVFDAITGEAIRTIRNGDDVGVVNFVMTSNVISNGTTCLSVCIWHIYTHLLPQTKTHTYMNPLLLQ